MAARISRSFAALLVFACVAYAATRAAADEGDAPAGRLETKHIDDGGRVKLEIGAAPNSSVKLVPFPEDLEEEAQRPQAKRPTEARSAAESQETAASAKPKPAAPKSNFQPRFKDPAVRRAQHVEPTGAAPDVSPKPATKRAVAQSPVERAPAEQVPAVQVPAEQPAIESPSADESASQPTAAAQSRKVTSPGKALIEEAFAKSKTAAADSDYSDIIDLCRRASKEGLKPKLEEYSQRLMSWSYNRRGEARAADGRDAEALADFESAVRFNNRSWRAVHNRGVSYAAAGRVAEAMTDFDHTIKLNQSYPNAYFNRGELLYAQGKFEAAIGDYSAAIDLGSPDALMYNSRGHAFYRMRRFGDALREYGQALRLDPHNAATLVNRGDTYLDLARYADAAADYRAAVSANPKLGRAYQAAAWLMASCPDDHYRNETLAIDAATKAIELDGEDFRNLETLAAAQANVGQFAEAKATQEKAIAKAPKHELVAAEKRMALYQRELAYREQSRQELIAAKDDKEQADAEKKTFPVKRASANGPEESQLDDDEQPQTPPQRTTRLPQTTPPPRSFTRPRMLPKAPTHPLGRN